MAARLLFFFRKWWSHYCLNNFCPSSMTIGTSKTTFFSRIWRWEEIQRVVFEISTCCICNFNVSRLRFQRVVFEIPTIILIFAPWTTLYSWFILHTHMRKTFFFLGLILSMAVLADNKPLDGFLYSNESAPVGDEWQSPQKLSLNKEQPRAYLFSFFFFL